MVSRHREMKCPRTLVDSDLLAPDFGNMEFLNDDMKAVL